MALTQAGTKPAVEYPSTDGEPMAQNTKQYRYITTLQGGLAAMFRDRPDVFVAGDLFWYPIEGDNKTRVAPDVMVVFGRPKRDRDSYRQWEEDNIAPQVVFEILSPNNTLAELLDKSLLLCCNDTPADYRHPPRKVNAHTKRTQQQKNCGASCTPHPSPTPHDAPNATPDYAHHPQTCA
jgi:hypothetical protein